MSIGIVYWITGLAGSGKTTIGTLLYRVIHEQKDNVIFLDGDQYRPILFPELGYSVEDRKRGGFRLGQFLKYISDQGIDVVVCTISMFDDVREWNRQNLKNYKEIYLEVPYHTLKARDQKGLYSTKTNEDVIGVNTMAELPKNPDIVINNDGSVTPDKVLEAILVKLGGVK